LKKISYWIRTNFGFSQNEASGFIVILIIMLLFLFLPLIYKNLLVNRETVDYSADQRKLDSTLARLAKHSLNDSSDVKQRGAMKIPPSDFDPNKISKKEMVALGFENRMAGRIINYRNKGGLFKVKKDLLKIYGFPPTLFLKLHPFILLPDSVPSKSNKHERPQLSFDINLADTSDLNQLKEIGSVLSTRIIKYRDKLGGFLNQDQFNEVYGLSPLALEELKKHTYIKNDFIPVKLDVNFADKEALSLHPYLSNKTAMNILNYRKQHGSFKTENEIREIKSLSEEVIKKILPYLIFNKNPTVEIK
jgi:DNA uptake protein ComE-like DNA-binding protein